MRPGAQTYSPIFAAGLVNVLADPVHDKAPCSERDGVINAVRHRLT
jgi:hypothetical protein